MAKKTVGTGAGLAGPILFAAVASMLIVFFWWLL